MQSSQKIQDKPLIATFERLCAEQLALCDSLEDVADQLGAHPDRSRCTLMAKKIGPTMARAHTFETEKLFPFLDTYARQKNTERQNSMHRSLTQLKLEHDEDVCLVGEVAEALHEFGRGSSAISPDAVGYLLRGLFVGLRRHLAYENEVVRSITSTH